MASVVVLGHAGLPIWSMAGDFAVNVFFALSGWLIGGILLEGTPRSLPRFYFNRSLRIWVPYFAAVFLLYVTAALLGRSGTLWYQFLFYDLTFTHYWLVPKIPEVIAQMPLLGTGSVFWSISVEEQFYVFAPLLLFFLPFGRRVSTWLVLSIGLTAYDYHYGSISLGVLAAVLRDRYGTWYDGWFTRIVIAVVAVLAAFASYRSDALYAGFVSIASIAVVLATSVEGPRSALGKLLGGISYPLYLNHWVGVFAANALGRFVELPMLLHVLLGYTLAILFSAMAYFAIDLQILRVRASSYSPAIGKLLMIAAYALLGTGVLGGLLLFSRLGQGSQ
jgi:peptidoglycan/LPS O-acetylase OafA/YrhL